MLGEAHDQVHQLLAGSKCLDPRSHEVVGDRLAGGGSVKNGSAPLCSPKTLHTADEYDRPVWYFIMMISQANTGITRLTTKKYRENTAKRRPPVVVPPVLRSLGRTSSQPLWRCLEVRCDCAHCHCAERTALLVRGRVSPEVALVACFCPNLGGSKFIAKMNVETC